MRNSEFRRANGHRHASLAPRVKYTLDALEELEKTYLSYTRVVNGLFLDYYGMPHWKTSVHPWLNVVNMEKRWAVILGDGSAKADFITSQDLTVPVRLCLRQLERRLHSAHPRHRDRDSSQLKSEQGHIRSCHFFHRYSYFDELQVPFFYTVY